MQCVHEASCFVGDTLLNTTLWVVEHCIAQEEEEEQYVEVEADTGLGKRN